MTENPGDKRTWTDSQLIAAVAASHSWRGVMRELGLGVTSAGSIQAVRRHVTRLGLDTSHFRGKRRWSAGQLRRAVATSYSWSELASQLGLASGRADERTRVKAHAVRLGLDLSHLEAPQATKVATGIRPDIKKLRDAGASIAATWFLLCGCNAAFPVEPTVYDLLVSMPDGVKRLQVKTTSFKGKDGWVVQVGRRPYSKGNRAGLIPYDPDSLDFFFILDGALNMYLIPSRVVAGRVVILLRNYSQYVVGNIGSLMRCAAPAALGQGAASDYGESLRVVSSRLELATRPAGVPGDLGTWRRE
jgi:hypothetical protein